ncbi:hypothetical protein HYH02_008019 [Chlamydomonas schloesseri]|uniref:Protein RFT1 homolog n=1 Tax=Chlamydomonas schloesseri TaxID=2026947 RepID=A0A835WG40_9CHLO|nr:hypothetical protein HYH02_008019 [Chlamydomonas schloesseri]|eukprot:KAG2446862.1 hypothetical protein HYH02_008019 [Chlamydomonas schloesseri]
MVAGADRASVVASGFLTLLASQIGTRLVTFIINLLIARHLSPEAYGLSSVQFHLLTTTALFISREGFRRGCLRFGGSDADDSSNNDQGADAAGSSSSSSNSGGKDVAGKGGRADVSRKQRGSGIDNRSVLRVACLVVPLGVVVTAAVCGLAIWRHDTAVAAAAAAAASGVRGDGGDAEAAAAVPYYREAVLLHGLAALVELAAEPFYILASVHLMFGVRVSVEFASTLTKSLVTLGLLSLPARAPALLRRVGLALGGASGDSAVAAAAPLPPALVFSAAQLALAAVALVGYGVVGWRLLQTDKRMPGARGWLSRWTPAEMRVLGTSAVFTLQAVEKLALAEGSKVVLATMQSAVNQGVYGLVSNLGSLVVRTLFQPLEEAAFAAFSAWGAEAASASTSASASNKGSKGVSGKMEDEDGGDGCGQAAAAAAAERRLAPLAGALGPMVKAVCVLGLAAAAFGPAYAYTLLRLVYGTRWSETEAPAVLAAYSVYVLLLALNGIGEAFVHAVLDARGLQASNALLLLFAGAHMGACVALVGRLGALGLVAADGANMLLRIAYSAWCIRRFFRQLPGFSLRRDLLPSTATLAAFAAAACAAGVSNYVFLLAPGTDGSTPQRLFLRRAAPHVAVAFGLLAVVGGVMLRAERATMRQVVEMRRRGRARAGGAAADGAASKKED